MYMTSSGSTAQRGNMVCTTCLEMLFNFDSFQKAWSTRISYRTTWEKVQNANQLTCAWCNMIYAEIWATLETLKDDHQTQFQGPPETVQKLEQLIYEEEIEIGLSFRDEYDTGREQRNLLMINYTSADGTPLFLSTVPISVASDDSAAQFIPDRPLICEMTSPKTFQLVRACVQECLQHSDDHENCPTLSPTNLPTRVIDCQDPCNPKIKIDTGSVQERYAALSYVWGEDQPQRTTTANLARYVNEGLDMQATPQTIKDAIHVVYELGIRYLWIDSYCIIQDSPEDKTNELPQMRRIYQNSYFTIIAAKTPKTSLGFLQDCPPPTSTFRVPFYCPNGALGSMTLAPRAWYNQYQATTEPINRRSWRLQERILAPRALVYASHTLQYLCQRGLKNIGDSVSPTKIDSFERLPLQFFDSNLRHLHAVPTSDELRAIIMVWHRVVYDYTHRGITVPSDKLPAISGVADEFHRILKCRYIAGMWEQHLLGDLLWIRIDDPLPRPEVVRAPSWSWPSINGLIGHPGGFVELKDAYGLRVLDWRVELMHDTFQFGEVKGGYLKVEGRVKKTLWGSERGVLYEHGPEGDLFVIGGGLVDSQDDVQEGGVVEEVLALPVALKSNKHTGSSRIPPKTLWGILLKPVEGTNEHTYRRAGLMRVSFEGKVEKEFETTPKREIVLI